MGEVKIMFKNNEERWGKKPTLFILIFFLFGGKFSCKPQFDARDQFSEDYSLFEAECTYPFFLLALSC